MQSNVNLTDENAPVLHADNHNPLADAHAIRKIMDMDNPQGHGDRQTRGSTVRLGGYNQRLNEGCLFNGRRPTCGRTPSTVLGAHEGVFKELLDHGVASAADSKGQRALKKGAAVRDGGGTTPPHEQIIHHLSPSFTTSLPYDTLKPQGPASICEEGGYATVSLFLPNETFVLIGSEVWADGRCSA